jgi:glutamate N-acetyltransferase/amino-acid N-acetyltransferase
MIAPNMGTMLAFIYTDADLSSNILQRCLKRAVDKSFNMVVVDGDTSPNDTVLLTATGKNDVREEDFQHGLDTVCTALTRMIASDGEGATKLITANVSGAKSVEDARDAVKAILRSPLVKCAIFGMNLSAGPGRVVTAIGNSSAEVDQDLVSVEIDAKDKEVTIDVNLGIGGEKATAWGCDLSYDYVRINSSYSSGISMK